jgi:hypothetical protein
MVDPGTYCPIIMNEGFSITAMTYILSTSLYTTNFRQITGPEIHKIKRTTKPMHFSLSCVEISFES